MQDCLHIAAHVAATGPPGREPVLSKYQKMLDAFWRVKNGIYTSFDKHLHAQGIYVSVFLKRRTVSVETCVPAFKPDTAICRGWSNDLQ